MQREWWRLNGVPIEGADEAKVPRWNQSCEQRLLLIKGLQWSESVGLIPHASVFKLESIHQWLRESTSVRPSKLAAAPTFDPICAALKQKHAQQEARHANHAIRLWEVHWQRAVAHGKLEWQLFGYRSAQDVHQQAFNERGEKGQEIYRKCRHWDLIRPRLQKAKRQHSYESDGRVLVWNFD